MTKLFKELILIALGKLDSLSRMPTHAEWAMLYEDAQKQSLIGICFVALQRLGADADEGFARIGIGEIQYLTWMGMAAKIQQRNEVVNRRCVALGKRLETDGYRYCVLKGQGVALLYGDLSGLRQSGDIDVWVVPEDKYATGSFDLGDSRKKTIEFLKSKGWKVGKTVIHHTDVEVFPDVEVEVHHIPSYTFSPLRYAKYVKWFEEQLRAENFDVQDENVGFACPSVRFNAVYSLLHIFRHVFHEGIGLRQLLDYYFILRHTTKEDREYAIKTLHWMGLELFAEAIMYVEQDYFALEDEFLLCSPDENVGRFILDEILENGNFGKYNEKNREAHECGLAKLYFHNVGRIFTMIKFFPSEVLWAPIWKPVHYVWRNVKGY